MPRISINRSDRERAMLSDALPYETPLIFSNEGLYRVLKSEGVFRHRETIGDARDVAANLIVPKTKYTIPFNYDIANNIDDVRKLSVIHPKQQIEVAGFYARFDKQIIHQCSLSPCSLRFPASIAKQYFESGMADGGSGLKQDSVELEVDGFELQPRFGSSYFAYRSFNLLSRFYNSRMFIELEKKFHHLLTMDISKCFPSIYTHSIGWAVKDKEFSKEHKDTFSFESEFDRLMQGCNYNETNGIVIGPEVSRIFAEVILQKVERNAITRIRESDDRFVHDIDYSVRRYVDDYFVFTTSEGAAEKIRGILQEELETYKLYINKSKTARTTVPYSTALTQARIRLSEYFDQELVKIVSTEESSISGVSSGRSKRWIASVKEIVSSRTGSYVGCSSLILTRIRLLIEQSLRVWTDSASSDQRTIVSVLLAALDLAFFVYAMDTRVRSTYLISQIAVLVNRAARNLGDASRELLNKRVFDGCLQILGAPSDNREIFSAERQNLLICLSDLGDDYRIAQDKLARIFGLVRDSSGFGPEKELDYFQIVTALFYMKDIQEYELLRVAIEKEIIQKLSHRKNLTIHAEHTMLVFDTLACPYVSASTKNAVSEIAVTRAGGSGSNPGGIFSQFRQYCEEKEWFVCWSTYVDIQYLLSKKELKAPYH